MNKQIIKKKLLLFEIKKKKKNKIFDEFLQNLEKKNFDLENLVKYSQQLQYKKYETETQIATYIVKLKKINDELNATSEKLKTNKSELENNLKDIQNLTKLKEDLKEKEIKLNEEEIQSKNDFKEKIEKEAKLDNLLKEKSSFFFF